MSEINNLDWDDVEQIDPDAALNDAPPPVFEFDPKTRKVKLYRATVEVLPGAPANQKPELEEFKDYKINGYESQGKHVLWAMVQYTLQSDGVKGRTIKQLINTTPKTDAQGEPSLSEIDDLLNSLGVDGTRRKTMGNKTKVRELVTRAQTKPEVGIRGQWQATTTDKIYNPETGKEKEVVVLRGQAKFAVEGENGATVYKPLTEAPDPAKQGSKFKVDAGTPVRTKFVVMAHVPASKAA